jgi:hypothetical protein
MKKVALFLILLSVQLVYGQNADWEVVVYAPNAQSILVLAPEGIRERIPLPDEVNGQFALSADRRYFAFEHRDFWGEGRGGDQVMVADLLEQDCGFVVTSSRTELEDTSAIVYAVGGFNPHDSTQLSIFYSSGREGADQYSIPDYGIVIVDVETGDVVLRVETMHWGEFIDWREDGILWSYYSDPPPFIDEFSRQLRYSIWNPATGVQGRGAEFFTEYFDGDTDTGDTLELTGEYIVPSYVVDTGTDLSYSALLYQGRDPQMSADDQPSMVYIGDLLPSWFTESGFSHSSWIADGNAIYIERSYMLRNETNFDTVTLLFRDGATQNVHLPVNHEFLTGTPDGWLAYDAPGGVSEDGKYHIYHYQYLNGELEMSVLAEFESDTIGAAWSLALLQRTPLGGTAEAREFPTVELQGGVG